MKFATGGVVPEVDKAEILQSIILERGTVFVPRSTLSKYGEVFLKKLNGGDPEIVVIDEEGNAK